MEAEKTQSSRWPICVQCGLVEEDKSPSLQPYIVPESLLYRLRVKIIYVLMAKPQSWKKTEACTSHEPSVPSLDIPSLAQSKLPGSPAPDQAISCLCLPIHVSVPHWSNPPSRSPLPAEKTQTPLCGSKALWGLTLPTFPAPAPPPTMRPPPTPETSHLEAHPIPRRPKALQSPWPWHGCAPYSPASVLQVIMEQCSGQPSQLAQQPTPPALPVPLIPLWITG